MGALHRSHWEELHSVQLELQASRFAREHRNLHLSKLFLTCCNFPRSFNINSQQQQRRCTAFELEQLSSCSACNDAFHIWHNGPCATINGFRLGRLASTAVGRYGCRVGVQASAVGMLNQQRERFAGGRSRRGSVGGDQRGVGTSCATTVFDCIPRWFSVPAVPVCGLRAASHKMLARCASCANSICTTCDSMHYV